MTDTLKIEMCQVKSVRADLLTGQVKITFTASLDEEMLQLRRHLAMLAFDEAPVTLTIKEHQMRLPFKPVPERPNQGPVTAKE